MKTQRYILFDWAIKKMLRSKANFTILEGFLSGRLDFLVDEAHHEKEN